jgi:hypothetical protein
MKRILLKILRYGFFALVCLATLIALVVAEENFRSKREWESYKRDAEARGVKFDTALFIPPPVPDDKNFAMTPLLKPLFSEPVNNEYQQELTKRLTLTAKTKDQPSLGNWQTGKRVDLLKWAEYLGDADILHALKKFDAEMNEISSASRLPYSRFPIRYEDNIDALLPHLGYLRKLAMLFELRALAALSNGQSDRAAEDLQTIFCLADSIKTEPFIISQLVRVGMLQCGVQVVWEGLAAHQWSENQLTALQNELQKIDLLQGFNLALKSEHTFGTELFENLISRRWLLVGGDSLGVVPRDTKKPLPLITVGSLYPRCIFYQNQLSISRNFDEFIFKTIDATGHRVFPQKARDETEHLKSLSNFNPYTILLKVMLPPVVSLETRFANAQTVVDEAAIACALERYRLAHGQYPDALDALTPQFIASLPHDVITGEPLKYRLTGDGQFILYSVGWNETDDGGHVALKKNLSVDFENGDWVWSPIKQ